ncbi:MAG TPA: OB-fold domain-containing protein [Dehalococcoidia bacterium]|nr:OB-fold domain-containing protein [Dehalococcoidia bacterium]
MSPRGTLWSYTVQYYKPPPPAQFDDPFVSYGVGLIDLPEGIRVLSMMSSGQPEELKIGSEVELVLEALYHNDDGDEVITWKFRPV